MKIKTYSDGFTIIEAIVAIAALIVIGGLAIGLVNAMNQAADAKHCTSTLAALTPLSQLCFQETALHDQLCVSCSAYNSAINSYNTSSRCGQFGAITPVVCPVPEPQ